MVQDRSGVYFSTRDDGQFFKIKTVDNRTFSVPADWSNNFPTRIVERSGGGVKKP